MAVTPEIAGAVATVMGIRVEDVTETIRRIREGGFWAKETRSPTSIRPSLRDCANLIGALLVGGPAKYAANAVVNLGNSIEEGNVKFIEINDINKNHISDEHRLNTYNLFSKFNQRGHNLIDGIELSLNIVANCYDKFSSRIGGFSIEVNTLDFTGVIGFGLRKEDQDLFGFKFLEFQQTYYNKGATRRGDFNAYSQCTGATLLQIIEVFRREKLL